MSGVTSLFTSKMSDEDELLLLSAAASAATIALAACSVKKEEENVLNDFGCVRCFNGATKEAGSIKLSTSLTESFLNDIFINTI